MLPPPAFLNLICILCLLPPPSLTLFPLPEAQARTNTKDEEERSQAKSNKRSEKKAPGLLGLTQWCPFLNRERQQMAAAA